MRLRDIARLELGAATYATQSLLGNENAVAIPVYQAPGSNALELSNKVRADMETLKKSFPQGMDYKIIYDPTQFVRQSIDAVVETLLEAVALVVLVVILFLQTWRASIIPLVAVPVSVIGTFAVLYALGFSINTLSLFGLVLAIGIVVDDSIVVVENVERHIANGLKPLEATKKAMSEVSRPIIAITLVLCAVFIPVAFVEGLTGEFYRQFALTIAISTVISAFNSLTLSPALAARAAQAARRQARRADARHGQGVRPLLRALQPDVHARPSDAYSSGAAKTVKRAPIAIAVYAGLVALTVFGFYKTPAGFIPQQDKLYLVGIVQLPPASSHRSHRRSRAPHGRDRQAGTGRARLRAVRRRVGEWLRRAVERRAGVLPAQGFRRAQGPDRRRDRRRAQRRSSRASRMRTSPCSRRRRSSASARWAASSSTSKTGRTAARKRCTRAVQDALGKAWQDPSLAGVFSSYQINVPQLDVDVDRLKVKRQGVKLNDVFQTLQVNLGSLYVNDFNRFGRTYRVVAQADAPFRSQVDDILPLKTRNAAGEMVPLGSLISVKESFGPDIVERFNGYSSADINGGPSPGHSSGEAQATISKILDENLPAGMTYEWTDLAFQQIEAGDAALFVFPLCVLFVFLVLAAQYESFSLPLAIILIVPMALLAGTRGHQAPGRRQQHLHADRVPGARGPRVQERHPDRGVRQAPAGTRPRSRDRRCSKPRACACAPS